MGIAYLLGGQAYDWLDDHFEKTRYARIRRKLWSALRGRILDAGCGTGRNFRHFHPRAKVTGVDISPRMLEVARKRAAKSRAAVVVRQMDLGHLHFVDGSFDAIVATFVLCVMPKQLEVQALKELVRVAKPGARLYFLEYVYSKHRLRRVLMMLTSFIPKILYNLRFNSTLPLIKQEERLEVEQLAFVHDDVVRLIVARRTQSS